MMRLPTFHLILLTFLACPLTLLDSHPAHAWATEIDGPSSSDDRALALVVANQMGDVFAAGFLRAESPDFVVLKLDSSSGDEIWRTTIDGPGSANDLSNAVAVHPSGDAIAAGFLCEESESPSSCLLRSLNFTVLRLSSSTGDVIWSRTFEDKSPESLALEESIATTQSQAVVSTKLVVDSSGDVIASNAVDGFAVEKLSGETGEPLWHADISRGFGQAFSVAIDNDGDVAVAGFTRTAETFDDFTVAKFDGATGGERWRFVLDGSPSGGSDFGRSVIFDDGGNVLASGLVAGLHTIIQLNGTNGALLWRASIAPGESTSLAIDSEGRVVSAGRLNDEFGVVKLERSTGQEIWHALLGAGTANSVDIDANDNILLSGSNFVVGKLAGESGLPIWEYEISGTAGGSRAFSVVADWADNAVAAGFASNQASGLDFTVLKLNGEDGTVFQPQARARAIPTLLDFSNVPLGDSATSVVRVLSSGTADLMVLDASFGEEANPAFSVAPVSPLPVALPRGASVELEVRFEPITKGEISETLMILTDGPDISILEVPVSGIGGAVCNDSLDNDNDGLTDFPNDIDCLRKDFPTEAPDFTVTSARDAVDRDPGDGACLDTFAECTLRAAIMESNALPGQQTVALPAGTYVLTIPGTDEDQAATGDLDIIDHLVLAGAGAEETIIDGNGIDGVLQVWSCDYFQPYCSDPWLPKEISGITITGGISPWRGSATDISQSGLVVTDSIIEANEGWASISAYFATLEISSSVIRDNRGGVVCDLYCWIEINDTLISGNSWGGQFSEVNLNISSSSITDNDEFGLRGWESYWVISDSTFSGNGASGLSLSGPYSTLLLRNSTVSGNRLLGIDFGIWFADELSILNSTITANHAGGVRFELGYDSWHIRSLIGNSIIADNDGPDCLLMIEDRLGFWDLVSAGHNLIGNATGCDFPFIETDLVGTEETPIDPMLGPLADNGGPTQTHALLPGSPAIDAGNPDEPGTTEGSCEVTDQRGVYRPLDGDGDGAAVCDIGAFEKALPVLIDIKPGNEGNAINPRSRGVIPVAILGSESFDVASVDGATLAFGPGAAGLVHQNCPHALDINRDGFTDLIAHFAAADSGIAAGDERACITGETFDGLAFEGCDSVRTVPAVQDATDRCPGTPGDAQVDSNGCSQEQFCNSITAGVTGKGRDLYQALLACRQADWLNDEPQSNRPGDCRFDRASMGCVAK
jgi:hypothetical protein